ncbi:TIM barrel protein [Rhizobium sp. P32RR-XVIII]|uniref:2-oxo-tetronate isomerase n=1 Tax=Rhizobium sp. P32RR-XVIII TaxID=2726738 RepID=UPI0014571E10|nr:2-oxo-tetronate isomerase [Rhizobium sp. P32RR-XVIII]NLS04039.1 TIM barrel protein [Rhizobium sp. P32RR-XVIII]
MPKFAANLTMMFNEVAFLDRFAAAAKAGFTAVEFLFPYDHPPEVVAALLKENGLTPALFNLPPGNWQAGERGLASLSGRQGEFRASVDIALTYARSTGVRRLHVMAGRASRKDPAAVEAYRDAVAFACDRAGQDGIDIVIEPINPRDMPGYFLDDFDFAADLIDALNKPNLKLQFDIYHRQIIHGDVLTGLRQFMPIIGHVQIASVPPRNEPGTGELDDLRVLRELDLLGYTGFVGCEYRPAGDTVAGLGWLDAFQK